MSTWTLAKIRQKVRQVTGRFSEEDLSNDNIDDYINNYYLYTFPAEVKLEQKHTVYEFITTANQATYSAPDALFTNYEPPVTVNNLSMLWYQDLARFENENPLQYNFTTPWTGDGVTTTFTTTLSGFPIYPSTLTISDNTELFEDVTTEYTSTDITITGSEGGTATINLSTGVISATFIAAPTDGQTIYLNYIQFSANRPEAMLYYSNTFTLSPVPDQAYVIKMGAYKVVDALENATDTPELNEWGPCIAYGAARSIFADFGENDAYSETTALYKEQVNYVLTRTEQDLLNVRAMPNF